MFCTVQHKNHCLINFINLLEQEESKKNIEKIEKLKKLVGDIIGTLKRFQENLDVYVQINNKLNENLVNMNLNYEILKSMKNFDEILFFE